MKLRSTSPFVPTSKGLVIALLAGFTVLGGGYSDANPVHPKLDPYKSISGAHKIDLTLLEIAGMTDGTKESLLAAFDNRSVQKTENGLILDVVAPGFPDHLPKLIENLGAGVIYVSENTGRIAVEVPDVQVLHALAAIDEIRSIHLTYPPVTHSGSVNGRAGDALRVDSSILQSFGVDGSGVLIGIISDSFAVTDNVKGPNTTVEPANTTSLSFTIPQDGEYTLVIQSESESQVFLQWSSDAALLSLEDQPGLSAACRSRLSLQGVSGARTVQTLDFSERPDLQGFIGGSCAPGSANSFSLFGFQATEGTTINFTTRSATSVYLSARSDCETRFNEECAEPALQDGIPVLTNALNQISGDLPESVFILQEGPVAGGIDEGAAMGELIYDIAPGATLAFHTAFPTEAVMADAIRSLAAIRFLDGAPAFDSTVLVDDINFFAEPAYQVGMIQAALEDVVNDGVSYFAAAGNSGDAGLRQVFNPMTPGAPNSQNPPNGADLHRWPNDKGYLKVTIPPGEKVVALLQWNQPWASLADNPDADASQIDLDFFLTRTPNTAGLAEAASTQGLIEGRYGNMIQGYPGFPLGNPIEVIDYTNSSSREETLYLAVNMFMGKKGGIPQAPEHPLEFNIRINIGDGLDGPGVIIEGINDPESDFDLRGPVSIGHVNSPLGMAVGAVSYLDTPVFNPDLGPSYDIDPQPYSSRGGQITYFFNRNSRAYANPVTALKPDFASVDGISNTFFGDDDIDLDGNPNFLGTSAAAPNAAAVAALLLNLNRSLTPDQIYTALKSTTIDVTGQRAAPGWDDVSGHGLINGLEALLFVEENYGRTTGALSPMRLSFEAGLESSGWDFVPVGGFDTPGSAFNADSLSFTTTAGANTLAWWESSQIVASPVTLSGGQKTIKTSPGNNGYLRLSANLHASNEDPQKTPGVRMRVLSDKFERSSELVLTSVGDGSLMPTAGDSRRFRHYSNLPATDSHFRIFLDLMGFDPTVDPGTTLSFRNLELVAFDWTATTYNSRLEKLVFFNNNNRGWTARTAPPLGTIPGRLTSTGLELGPVDDPESVGFSFWGSPEAAPQVILEQGRFYRATFRVKSNLPADQARQLPVFRLRMNDETLQMSSLVLIDARRSTSMVPVGGQHMDYILTWEVPSALHGKAARFGFDMLYIPNDDKDPNARLTLEALRVESYTPPEIVGGF
ncbi:MAG: S8 family serine peptidase [Candidatus Sumerlaeia bacterium]|nr:S8 family serine peptidase [Candidatus Sumerlaeia bacterium]